MKVILNLLPLKLGGGVQVALDFIAQAKIYGRHVSWKIVCRERMPFIDAAGDNIELVEVVEDSLWARLHFEYIGCRSLVKAVQPDAVFTLFGPQWPGVSAFNIVGCAYSNLFYPELDFWGSLPWYKRLIKKFVDWQRKRRLHGADIRIFETSDLARRAINQCGFESASVRVVKPACSSLVSLDGDHAATRERCLQLPDGYRVLLVSGYHPNKNIETLVLAAAQLKSRGAANVRFILTLPHDHSGTKKVLDMAQFLGVSEQVYNFGPVPQQGCSELYRACDAAVLPSALESFSNMIIESWAMQKPLLISDFDWSRSLCEEAAIYFRFRDAGDLADRIVSLSDGNYDSGALVSLGEKQLATYPNSAHRFRQYLDVIEDSVLRRGKACSAN